MGVETGAVREAEVVLVMGEGGCGERVLNGEDWAETVVVTEEAVAG